MKFLDKLFSLILGLSIGIVLEYYLNHKVIYHGLKFKKKKNKHKNKDYRLITEAYTCGVKL